MNRVYEIMQFLANLNFSARRLYFYGATIFILTAGLAADIAPVPEYQIGDLAEGTITAPLDFDALDPLATSQARENLLREVLPLFRFYPNRAQDAEAEFRAGFAQQHAWFIRGLLQCYRHSKLNQTTINHPSFGRFLGWVQQQNPGFPCATNLARAWALGDPGDALREECVRKLRQTMQHYIHADSRAADAVDGAVKVFPVKATEVIADLETVEKRSVEVSKEKLYTLSEARAELAKAFSSHDLPLAKFLAAYLKENCMLDPALAERLQKRKEAGLWITQHFHAGQVIVQSGQAVDAAIKSALEALAAKRSHEQRQFAAAAAREQKITAMKERLQGALAVLSAKLEQAEPLHYALWSALGGLLLVLYLVRRHGKTTSTQRPAGRAVSGPAPEPPMAYTVVLHPERHETIFLPVKNPNTSPEPPASVTVHPEAGLAGNTSWEERARQAEEHAEELLAMVRAGLAPHLAKELMNRLVQELLTQRGALLQTQQAAGRELASIEARFTALCRQLQERLNSYELRTQDLEEKLADKHEQNSHLLKAVIASQKKLQSTQPDDH